MTGATTRRRFGIMLVPPSPRSLAALADGSGSVLPGQDRDERVGLAGPVDVGDPPAGRCLDEIERHDALLLLARRREARGAGRAIGCGAGRHLELDSGRRPVLAADQRVEVELADL